MKSTEAYKILGLAKGASEDEIKKAFKKKAAKLHPDVNKSDSADTDFKKLNEAYQYLINKKDNSEQFYHQHIDIDNLINTIFGQAAKHRGSSQVIQTSITITFKEAALGCTKPITYSITERCSDCDGKGTIEVATETNCLKCNGTGHRTYVGDEKELPCTTCKGLGKAFERRECSACHGSTTKTGKHTTNVALPPGVVHGGTYMCYTEQNIKIHVQVSVLPDSEMKYDGTDIKSSVKISLLEALKGTVKEVNTVRGTKMLKIPGPIKHGNEIRGAGLGVPPYGAHVFEIQVEYPEDVSSLIETLEKQKEGANGI